MLPLKNVKILDLSEGLECNLATMYLTRFGADVTKLEKPEGDCVRKWEPIKNGESLYFQYLNSGKKSIVLDITKDEDMEKFKEIICLFDVVCVSDKTGYIESLGIGYEEIKKIKKDIIYVSYSYFGKNGSLSKKSGSSLIAQALGVAMDMTGVRGEEPVQSAPTIAEHYASGYIATGIMFALIDKVKRGVGQMIDISLQDAIFSSIEAAPAAYSTVKELHTRKGNFDPSCAPYDTFETSDGYVSVGCATQIQWERFCDILGFDELKCDPRFLTNEGRRTDYIDILRPILAEKMIKMNKLDVEAKCRKLGIPCCAVLNIAEITDMKNTRENGFIQKITNEKIGEMIFPALPFSLKNTESFVSSYSSEKGENNNEIL